MEDPSNLISIALDSLDEGVAILDRDGAVIFANTAWIRFGQEYGDSHPNCYAIGTNFLLQCKAEMNLPAGQFANAAYAGIADVLAGRRTQFELDYPCRTHSEERWCHIRVNRMAPPYQGAVLYHKNITSEKITSIKLDQQFRLYKVLSEANWALIHGNDPVEILERICRSLVETGGMRMAWFGIVQDSVVVPLHAYGSGVEYLVGIDISASDDSPIGRGPTGIACRTLQPVWCQDFLNDPRTAPWWERAKRFGWASSASVPTRVRGVTRVMTMYSGVKNAFDPEVCELLLTLSSDITYALESFAEAEERRQIESQLRELQKMEALGTLAGGIAHDFNNILGAILGNVSLAISDCAENPSALESLQEIERSAVRARDLVSQILTFSRKGRVQREVVELRKVILDSARFLRTSLPADIQVQMPPQMESVKVWGNAVQLEQVMLNVGTNAAHAISDKSGSISFDLRVVHISRESQSLAIGRQSGMYAQIAVHDNGVGMDEATLNRIFEPFFTTKPVGHGTGIGLSIVHGIVTSHDGWVSVQSEPGVGTSFEIYLPLFSDPVNREPKPVEPLDSTPVERPLRILYLDDDEAMGFLTERLFRRSGVEITCFQEPERAIQAFAAEPFGFDLVITDYKMPRISGFQVVAALREIRPEVPVAITSGYITEKMELDAQQLGVSYLIHKPNSVEEFTQVISDILAKEQGAEKTD